MKIDRPIIGVAAKTQTTPLQPQETALEPQNAAPQKNQAQPIDRPPTLRGSTYKLKTPLSPHALYVTINDIDTPQGLRPYEVFINSKAMNAFQWITALTRSISAMFRHAAHSGEDATFLVEELKQVTDPNGGYFKKGRYVPSLVAEIGCALHDHFAALGLTDEEPHAHQADAEPTPSGACPACGQRALIASGGCEVCTACGHSVCG